MLQKYVAETLEIEIGWYYHFAIDLHLYENY
jgi:thymidylate synthase